MNTAPIETLSPEERLRLDARIALAEMPDSELRAQLDLCGGNVNKLAEVLGVTSGLIRGRLSRAGIPACRGRGANVRHNAQTAAVIAMVLGPEAAQHPRVWDEKLAKAILAQAGGSFSRMGELLGITRQAAKQRYDRAIGKK